MNHTEIEFKWEANSPRAFERVKRALARGGVRVGAWKTYFITDVYVDTPAQDFEKQKIAFRVRHVHPCWQATFKTRTEIRNGKAVRREETLPLRGVENLAQALEKLHRKKIWQGLNMQNLRPLFTLKNKRRACLISNGKMQAELALDTCEILVAGRRVCFKEVELEYKKGPAAAFEKIAAQLTRETGLKRAEISKVKTALLLRGLWGGK